MEIFFKLKFYKIIFCNLFLLCVLLSKRKLLYSTCLVVKLDIVKSSDFARISQIYLCNKQIELEIHYY